MRQSQRTQGGGLEGVEIFHYAGPSDTPAWTQLGTKWTRNITGIGGNLAATQNGASGTLLQLLNLHGDVVATATLNPSDTEPVATYEFDEFGVPKQGGTPQFGWLGGKGRRTEFASGVIQMGARSYVPSMGRFISADPIVGGSANTYDYAGADPVNGLDLTGTAYKGSTSERTRKLQQRARREAKEKGYKQFHAICVGKAGCYMTQAGGGGGGSSLAGLAADLVKTVTRRIMNPVSSQGILGDALMDAARPIIDQATGGEKGRLQTCYRTLVDGVEDGLGLLGAAASKDRRGRAAIALFAAGRCAGDWFGNVGW